MDGERLFNVVARQIVDLRRRRRAGHLLKNNSNLFILLYFLNVKSMVHVPLCAPP